MTAADDVEDALREVENLVKIPNYPNIVQYYTCWRDTLQHKDIEEVKKVLGGSFEKRFKYERQTFLGSVYIMFFLKLEFQLEKTPSQLSASRWNFAARIYEIGLILRPPQILKWL